MYWVRTEISRWNKHWKYRGEVGRNEVLPQNICRRPKKYHSLYLEPCLDMAGFEAKWPVHFSTNPVDIRALRLLVMQERSVYGNTERAEAT